MKNYSLLLFLSIFICISNLNSQNCFLQTRCFSSEGKTDTTFYYYDSKTQALSEVRFRLNDGENLTEIHMYYEGKKSSIREGNYSHDIYYNKKGQIETITDYDDLRVTNFFHRYSYDEKGRLIKETNFETPYMEDTSISSYIKYYYDGDKLIKMEEYGDYPNEKSLPKYTSVFEYDKWIKSKLSLGYYSNETEKYLITKCVCKDVDGVIVDENSYTTTFIFNKEGFPIKCTTNYLNGAENFVKTYTYNCK